VRDPSHVRALPLFCTASKIQALHSREGAGRKRGERSASPPIPHPISHVGSLLGVWLLPGIEKLNRCQNMDRAGIAKTVNIDKTDQKPVQNSNSEI
jgi:hypothetical protein